ncbi:unnamed protein product, partial [Brassica rapa subsp. trilocularis]
SQVQTLSKLRPSQAHSLKLRPSLVSFVSLVLCLLEILSVFFAGSLISSAFLSLFKMAKEVRLSHTS